MIVKRTLIDLFVRHVEMVWLGSTLTLHGRTFRILEDPPEGKTGPGLVMAREIKR